MNGPSPLEKIKNPIFHYKKILECPLTKQIFLSKDIHSAVERSFELYCSFYEIDLIKLDLNSHEIGRVFNRKKIFFIGCEGDD